MPDPDFNTRIETYFIHARGSLQRYLLAAMRHAHALRIGGWIRDLEDGSVEALVQGPPDQIDLMLEWLRRGPPGASVKEFHSREEYIDKRYDRFERQ
jgi:acylphosphatase